MSVVVRGFHLPDGEEHLVTFLESSPEFAGGPTYQLKKLLACLPHVKDFRRAVDVGAHCGLWTRVLAQMFRWTSAFEPIPEHRECLERNLAGRLFPDKGPPGCVELLPYALGSAAGLVSMHTDPSSSGDTFVRKGGEIKGIEMRTLDSLRLSQVDFVKIDCEGFEYFVLAGGEETIRKQRPFVVVEQKPNKGRQHGIDDHAALVHLERWGAKRVFEISGDFGYRWP